jgi:hypothetical protein
LLKLNHGRSDNSTIRALNSKRHEQNQLALL